MNVILSESVLRKSALGAEESSGKLRWWTKHIARVCAANRMPCRVTSTACYYYMLFVFKQAREFDRFFASTACVLLACKSEESPKKLRDILTSAYNLYREKRYNEEASFTPAHTDYEKLRSIIIKTEEAVLVAIGIRMEVRHAHASLISYAELVCASKQQTAYMWALVNESYRTTIPVRYACEEVALAAVLTTMNGDEPHVGEKLETLQLSESSWQRASLIKEEMARFIEMFKLKH